MHKIYYDKERNFTIVDVSGVKSIEQIKEEFGDCDYQNLEIDPHKEQFEVVDGVILKKTLV